MNGQQISVPDERKSPMPHPMDSSDIMMADMIVDYITGRKVPHIGAEANRQQVERYLVEKKGYQPDDIQVDMPISVDIDGASYQSTVDLVIRIEDRPMMAIKCAAGSLGSREREIVSAARLLAMAPLPLAAVSDGVTAILIDVATRKKIGEGLDAIPHHKDMVDRSKNAPPPPLSPDQRAREKLVFRSYDSMNVNVAKKDMMNDNPC